MTAHWQRAQQGPIDSVVEQVSSEGGTVHRAADLQFERIVDEFVQWRAVPEDERSPAPAWWWGPAFEVAGVQDPLPAKWCASLRLPGDACYADGAQVFLRSLAAQTSLPWPDHFPRQPANSNAA